MLFFHTADWKYVVKQVKKAEKDMFQAKCSRTTLHLLKNPDTPVSILRTFGDRVTTFKEYLL